MINHAYTLLRNAPGDLADPWSEFSPPGFRPVVLDAALTAVRNVLFGTNPDAFHLNYRLRQYMTILHASDFADHVVAFDSRVTYWPFDSPAELRFGAFATGFRDAPPLEVIGDPPPADDATGRSIFTWRAAIVAGGGEPIAWWPLSPFPFHQPLNAPPDGSSEFSMNIMAASTTNQPPPTTRTALVFTAGYSSPTPLIGSTMAIRAPASVKLDDAWDIVAFSRPDRDIAVVVDNLESLGSATLGRLFSTTTEPNRSHAELWRSSRQVPDRLVGALLALIWRTEESRTGKLAPSYPSV